MQTTLTAVHNALETGRHLDAWEAAQAWVPLSSWRGPEAEVLAGRLAFALGAPRQGNLWHLRAGRRYATHPLVRYYHARALLNTFGPWRAWQFLHAGGEPEPADRDLACDWWALRASVAGRLRDFETAEACLQRAERLAPERPWLLIERSILLEAQDRHDDAVAAVLQIARQGAYRAGVARAAYLLPKLGRPAEALLLLEEADRRMQAAEVAAHVALLRLELARPAEALQALDRHSHLAPLLEPAGQAWEAGRRSDALYLLGETAAAARSARAAKAPFFDAVAERLEQGAQGQRVVLPVEFVQQHHLTCAPASLAALTRYWGRAVDHLELARRIAYSGTPGWREREWALSNGWCPREFTVTWDAARALLDRGLPFTLVTTALASAHEQTVCGYDEARGTLLVRDPSNALLAEFLAQPLLAEQAATGPRGLLLVPASELARLEGLVLPDAGLYDRLHALDLALQRHDRAAAQASAETLDVPEVGQPDLALRARHTLAVYDMDDAGQLAVTDAWLERRPGTAWLEWRRVELLRVLGRVSEAEQATATRARSPEAEPLHWQRHAEDLLQDGRRQAEARRWLRRALQRQPQEAPILASLARLASADGRADEALQLRRFAACLEPTHEAAQQAYFASARQARREHEALRLLHDRVQRFGAQSSAPARTLFSALDDLQRTHEGFEVLERALAARPEDGELLLFAAEAEARYGRFETAAARLEKARGSSHPLAWHRTAALLAQLQGHSQAAVAHWRTVVAGDPRDLAAQQALCELLKLTEGLGAVREHLAAQLERCPRHHGLLRLQVEWARDQDHGAAAEALGQLLAHYPTDAWAHRERALMAVERHALDEARAEAEQALELEPWAPASPGILGHALNEAGLRDEARPLLQRALELAADYGTAAQNLVALAADQAERRAALAFLLSQVERQGQAGGGLFLYRSLARGTCEPEEVLAQLRRLTQARPDLWQAFSALAREATDQGLFEEATAVIDEGLLRFPLVLALRLDVAYLWSQRGDAGRERAALEEAVRQEPGAAQPARHLAELLARDGRGAEAQALLEQLVARHPTESENHGFLADVLWQRGQRDGALAHVVRAVEARPGYEWAWERLREWSGILGQPDASRETARRLTTERPAEGEAWIALARELDRPGELAERLAALDRASAALPRSVESHDLRATWLCEAGRYDEALAACEPPGWKGVLPRELRGRALWVRFQRGDAQAALDGMQALLEKESSYGWGTRRLLEWQRECGSAEQYLEAAERLVRLAPADPSAYGQRGEALERLGRSEPALADYQRAVDLDADYPFARGRLFSLLLELGRLDEAEALLGRIAHRLAGPEQHARRAQVLARRGQAAAVSTEIQALLRHPEATEAAARLVAQSCLAAEREVGWLVGAVEAVGSSIHPDAAAGLATALARESRPALARALRVWPSGSPARCRGLVAALEVDVGDTQAVGRARELTRDWPLEARHWFLLERALDAAGTAVEERLEALARAAALDGGLVDALDQQAALLAEQGRFEEALELCDREVNGLRPLPLRGREAWVLHLKGEPEQAVSAMRVLLDEDPRYTWGWGLILSWLSERRDSAQGYLELARRRCTVEPGDPDAWVHLGQALERSQKPAEAAEAYARALALDPQGLWSAESLFDLHLKHGRLDEAAAALAKAPRADTVTMRVLQLHLRRAEVDAADARLAELCAQPQTRRDVLEYVLRLYQDDRLDWRSARILSQALKAPGVHPLVARLHVERLLTHGGPLAALRAAERMLLQPELVREGVAGYLELAANRGQHGRLRYFVWRHREVLRADTHLWGWVGYALMKRSSRVARRWMADWRGRRDARVWMLANLALLLRQAGDDAQAAEASRAALRLPAEHCSDQHRLWLALDEGLAGRAEQARRLLLGLDETQTQEYYRFFLGLARALAALEGEDAERRGEARQLISQALARDPHWHRDQLKRRIHRAARLRVGERHWALRWLRA